MKKYFIEKIKALRSLFVRRGIYWKDVPYHTGFYRFNKKYQTDYVSFKINGIPCLAHDECDKFVFFSETDLRDKIGLVCVEKHYT